MKEKQQRDDSQKAPISFGNSLPDNPTDQKIEAIAQDVMIGKCPSGEDLLLLARGYIEALARGRRAERVIHEWIHDADQVRIE